MPGRRRSPCSTAPANTAWPCPSATPRLTPDGHHFNTSILVGQIRRHRWQVSQRIHLPGHDEYDEERAFQHLEKRYFEPGDLGFPVWRMLGGIFGMCILQRPALARDLSRDGLQGVEMVVLGFNTPSVNSQKGEEGIEQRLFHHRLSLQAGAYQNATWVVAVAKAGSEDGHHLMGGTMIVPRVPRRLLISCAQQHSGDHRKRRRRGYFGFECIGDLSGRHAKSVSARNDLLFRPAIRRHRALRADLRAG